MTGKTTDGNPAPGSNAGDGDGSGQSSTPSGSNDGAKSKGGAGDEQGGAAGGRDGKGGGKGGPAAIGDGKGVGDSSAGPQAIDPENASSDGGSPLVPILIALAVLAAISIGVVAMRKNREDADPGAPASPEAG